jgi:hypothetical protein
LEFAVIGGIRTKINNELDNLEASNPLLPPDANTTSALEIVPVHNDMNSEVQVNHNPGDRGVADKLGVAENRSGTVVIAVQEG